MSRARDLANTISGAGTFSVDAIPALPTSKITSGTFADARLSSSSITQHVDLSNLNASNLTSGTVPSARVSLSASDIPALATSKITSGTFADARLSSSSVTQHVDLTNLNADNLTSGTVPNARITLDANEIPDLPASKVTSGSFATARIPTLDGSKISGGTFGSVNGSNLSSLPSSAPTTSQVESAMAGTSGGNVGSYAFLRREGERGGNQSVNTTTSGSNLEYACIHASDDSPSGTWRQMGYMGHTSQSDVHKRATLWIRQS